MIVPTSDAKRVHILARSLRRSLFAACVDRTLSPQDLREELLAALEEYHPAGDTSTWTVSAKHQINGQKTSELALDASAPPTARLNR